ncbi:unnamed protein product [Mytilus edulis]|uniref:SUEL-type lectin domain-containing protein n=1 Tax=Mytilus edulis TaxID=6550 RepID=A0A8S3QXN0_MYTED|nr:unnamed protein product [Mytilus edulis]
MRLNCSSTNDILKIIGASYGQFTSFLCHQTHGLRRPHNGIYSVQLEDHLLLHQRCDGKPTCTLKPSTTLFGDPCTTTPKYLEVLYRCVATLIHKTTSSMVTDLTTPMKTELSSPTFPGSSEIVFIAETCNEDRSNFSVSVEVFVATLTAIVLIMIFIIVILVIYFRILSIQWNRPDILP